MHLIRLVNANHTRILFIRHNVVFAYINGPFCKTFSTATNPLWFVKGSEKKTPAISFYFPLNYIWIFVNYRNKKNRQHPTKLRFLAEW